MNEEGEKENGAFADTSDMNLNSLKKLMSKKITNSAQTRKKRRA